MNSFHFPLYILLILLLMSVIIPLISKKFDGKLKFVILATIAIVWVLGLATLADVVMNGSYYYNVSNWDSKIGIQFVIDEFSMFMSFVIITLTALIIIFSLKDIEDELQPKQFSLYYTLIFLLLLSMIGITITNDLFNTYVFMEILAITSCGIISIKRKKENYMASFRYLILNTLGSLSFLFGLAMLYMVVGYLNITHVHAVINEVWEIYPKNILLTIGLMITGLAIKAAIFPLHVWLPDAHSTAPTPSSALLSSLVVKVYIFTLLKIIYRVLGSTVVLGLGINTFMSYFAALGMIMGSVFAIGQKDIKRMLAYSSVAQVGYIILGISLTSEQGLSAALFHVVSHALMKSALFLSAGTIIYYKGKRDVRQLDGIGYEMPITMGVFTVAALGMIGIPGINGFMSKIYLSFAVLDANRPMFLAIILASSFLNAVYYLPIIISAFLRESSERKNIMSLERLPKTMLAPMVIIAALCIIAGFYPQIIMNLVSRAVPTFLL